jgi:outer membrane receptor protein involved in Fe transport
VLTGIFFFNFKQLLSRVIIKPRQMKQLLPLFFFSLFATALFAQNKTINGKITDLATKEGLAGATVLVKGTTTGTVTDSLGNFKLTVAPDAKTLTVSYVGYIAQDVAISTGNTINVKLETADIPGKEVVVTSSRVSESIIEAPAEIEKMTANEIKSAASGDFYQSIANFKGVDMVTTSAFFKVVNLRGFGDTRSLRTKQFIDGVDNESPGLNFPIGNMVGSNDLDLQSVEVVSGPASALYGANAMQGLISMSTKSPYDFQGLSVQVKGGGTSIPGPYFDVQMRYATTFGKDNRWAFKFTGEYTQMTDWPATNDSLNRYGNISADVNVASAIQQEANAPYCPTCPVTTAQHNTYAALTGWLAFNPAANNFDPSESRTGFLHVQAPGYMEGQLADNNAQNIKFSTGLYYKLKNDVEISAVYRFGFGTAVYQATTRYQIKDFIFNQPTVQIKGKNFFVRAYTSTENAGGSYNIALAGAYVSADAVPAYVSAFTNAYFNTIQSLVGGFANCATCFTSGQKEWVLDSARNVGTRAAQSAWLVPGTAAFNDTLNKILHDKNSLTGAQFYDRSALVHVEGQYNWDFVQWIDIITGASYRLYLPNSEGTILQDTASEKIRVSEVGAYLQATKRLFNDAFKIIGSIRADKNSNFNAQVSPRGSLVYTYKAKHSTHTFRFSATSAFRDPTLQDQYLYLDIGTIKLIGNLNGLNNVYTQNSVTNALNILGETQTGSNSAAAEAALVPINLAPIKPEHLTSFEFGYRSEISNRLLIDLTGYYGIYTNFIGFTRVVSPYDATHTAGNPADNIIAGYYQPLQTWVNSPGAVPSWGADASISYYAGRGITPYINYTYADLNDNNISNNQLTVLSGFNTPRHKINIGLNARKVWKGLGFSANWKWLTAYQWESPFANGIVPSYHTLDLQIYYEVPSAYSTFRIGGSNVYNNRHIEAVGSPEIGALYYVAYSFELANLKKQGKQAQ